MLFDSTPTPDLSIATLPNLSWLLRHPEAWPSGFEWNYYDCRTCAMGLASTLWSGFHEPVTGVGRALDWVSHIFNMENKEAEDIFSQLDNILGFTTRFITPIHVADAIDQYLATH